MVGSTNRTQHSYAHEHRGDALGNYLRHTVTTCEKVLNGAFHGKLALGIGAIATELRPRRVRLVNGQATVVESVGKGVGTLAIFEAPCLIGVARLNAEEEVLVGDDGDIGIGHSGYLLLTGEL